MTTTPHDTLTQTIDELRAKLDRTQQHIRRAGGDVSGIDPLRDYFPLGVGTRRPAGTAGVRRFDASVTQAAQISRLCREATGLRQAIARHEARRAAQIAAPAPAEPPPRKRRPSSRRGWRLRLDPETGATILAPPE